MFICCLVYWQWGRECAVKYKPNSNFLCGNFLGFRPCIYATKIIVDTYNAMQIQYTETRCLEKLMFNKFSYMEYIMVWRSLSVFNKWHRETSQNNRLQKNKCYVWRRYPVFWIANYMNNTTSRSANILVCNVSLFTSLPIIFLFYVFEMIFSRNTKDNSKLFGLTCAFQTFTT